MGSIPAPGRFHMLWRPQPLSPRSRACAPQQEKSPQREARAPQLEIGPHSPKSEKARMQQQRPSTVKN